MSDDRMVFYVPGETGILDMAVKDAEGSYIGQYSRENLDYHKVSKPTTEIITLDEACNRIEEINKERFSGIEEITEEQWEEMLCVLPPLQYGTRNNVTSFLLCEAVTGAWYSAYAKIKGKYYTGHRNISGESADSMTARFVAFAENNS